MESQTLTLILGSAAIGALVSSAASAVTSYLERRHRQRELLLKKSIELSQTQVRFFQEFAKATGKSVMILPFAVYVRWYHRQLQHLLKRDKLTADLEARFSDQINRDYSNWKPD